MDQLSIRRADRYVLVHLVGRIVSVGYQRVQEVVLSLRVVGLLDHAGACGQAKWILGSH